MLNLEGTCYCKEKHNQEAKLFHLSLHYFIKLIIWCYLIIYLFKKYLLSTYAVSGFMQLLELQGTCVLFYDILLFFSLFHPPYPLYLGES